MIFAVATTEPESNHPQTSSDVVKLMNFAYGIVIAWENYFALSTLVNVQAIGNFTLEMEYAAHMKRRREGFQQKLPINQKFMLMLVQMHQIIYLFLFCQLLLATYDNDTVDTDKSSIKHC